MDALKTIAAGSVKDTTPEFGIGDTVKVSRCSKVLLLLREAVALLKHLL